jgi:hypothetical protein
MNTVEEYNRDHSDLIEIKSAEYKGDYSIQVIFNDGVQRLVHFKSFLEASYHSAIRKYLDENKFKEFEIIDGNLNWNDYDLIFPIYDLYKDKITDKDPR